MEVQYNSPTGAPYLRERAQTCPEASYFSRLYNGLSSWRSQEPLSEKIITPTFGDKVTTKCLGSSVWISSHIDCCSKTLLKTPSQEGMISVQNFYKVKSNSIFILHDPAMMPSYDVILNNYEKNIPEWSDAYWIPTEKGLLKAPKNGACPLQVYPLKLEEGNSAYLIPTHSYDFKALVVEAPQRNKFTVYDFSTDIPTRVFHKEGFEDIYTSLENHRVLCFGDNTLQLWNTSSEKLEWSFNNENGWLKGKNFRFFEANSLPAGIVVGEDSANIYVIDINRKTVMSVVVSNPTNKLLENFQFVDKNRFICRYRESDVVHLCSLLNDVEICIFPIGKNLQYGLGSFPILIKDEHMVTLNKDDNKKLMHWDLSGSQTRIHYEPANLPLHELHLSGDRIVGLHYLDSISTLYIWDFNTGKILLRNESKGAQTFSNLEGNMLTIDCSNKADFGHHNSNPSSSLDVKLSIWDLDSCQKTADITESFAYTTGPQKLMYSFQSNGSGKYTLDAWWGLNHKTTLIKKSYTLK